MGRMAPGPVPLGVRGGILLLGALIAGSTLPRALLNYGPDENGANSAQSALNFVATGIYHSSRDPGNPLFDYLLALVVPWGGYVASNLMVGVFYVLTVAAFACLVRGRPAAWIVTGIFALTPVVLVNAVATIDYLPGLAAMLWSYVCAIHRRYALAGLLLGFSIGFRLPDALFLLALALFLWLRRDPKRKIGLVALISLTVGLACYIPILATIGLKLFDVPNSPVEGRMYLLLVAYNGLMLFGPGATAALIVLTAAHARQIGTAVSQAVRGTAPELTLEVTIILLEVGLFVRHADQTAYLLPAVPFIYLLLSHWVSPRQWLIAGLIIVSTGVVTLGLKGGESGKRTVAAQIAWGPVVVDYQERSRINFLRAHICQADFAGQSVVMTGLGQALTVENPAVAAVDYTSLDARLRPAGIAELPHIYRCVSHNVYLVYALSQANVEILRHDGAAVYIFSEWAPSEVINEFGYDPMTLGIPHIDVTQETTPIRAQAP